MSTAMSTTMPATYDAAIAAAHEAEMAHAAIEAAQDARLESGEYVSVAEAMSWDRRTELAAKRWNRALIAARRDRWPTK